MTLYLIRAGCPHCGEVIDHVEETESPVGLMQDVGISARYCPFCGFGVVGEGADEWDVREEAEIERVEATDPADVDVATNVEDVDGATRVDSYDDLEEWAGDGDWLILDEAAEPGDQRETWHSQAADYHGARFVYEEEETTFSKPADTDGETCPECGSRVRYGWENGTRVCVRGHRWTAGDGEGSA